MNKHKMQKQRILCAVLSTAMLASNLCMMPVSAEGAVYKDGIYEGTGTGFNGNITVSVTIEDGAISAIDVKEQNETPAYWKTAQESIPAIITANRTEGVDAVSGATYSSEGIKQAVNNALAKSMRPDCFASGSGSISDPYVIQSADQLAAFAESVDGGENYLGEYIVLGADIDLTDTGNWNPIGAEGAASQNLDKIFAGTFDGQGHTVKGLTIVTDENAPYEAEQNIGLFSVLLSTAKVSGIRLEDVSIHVAGAKVVRAGGITGDITSNAVSGKDGMAVVDSCIVKGSVSAQTDSAMVMTAGIAGRAAGNASISNCISDTAIRSASGSKIAYGAGIVSMAGNDTYVTNCANSGDITVLSATGFSLYAGGVVGMMTSEQYNCFSTGNVTVGTIAQEDAASGAGLIDGALMPAASGAYDYYVSGGKMYYTDENGAVSELKAVSHGAGSMNAEGTFAPAEITEEQLKSGAFADLLNSNLNDISKKLQSKNIDTELKLWHLSDAGETVLSDEVYINDAVDTSIFEAGDGTKDSPYQIKSAEQLRNFAASLSDHIDYTGAFIELTGDIDVSDAEWTPIGDSDYAFNGSFDGKGHTVSGMHIGSAEEAKALEEGENYIGFFSVLGTNAVVRNLNLSNILVNLTYGASAYAGGIAAAMDSDAAGYQGAIVDSCSTEGSIKITAETGNNFVGGITAYMYKGAVINCKTNIEASCTVKTGAAYGEAGGIAALVNRGLIANSYSLGSVYGGGNREDEGMAVISSLVAVNAGYVVNCYGNGGHETNDYSLYTGTLSGWITGIGHTYDCYYNADAPMKIGETTVNPVADIGTIVSSGVSDDGMVYTGGVAYNNEAYHADNYSAVAEKLNANFTEFPVELTQFGLTNDSLKTWVYDTEVTFAEEYASAAYVQPEAEIVKKEEHTLQDGTWYGRDSEMKAVVTITVENGEITKISASDGSKDGKAYEEALQTAKDKSVYGDKTSYDAADISVFAGGKGTENEPYLVSNEAQLRYIAEAMNEDVDWENVWFALDGDIALSGGDWLPIGHAIQAEIKGQKENFAVYPFRGSFDGRNYTISNLTIGSKDAPADIYLSGLFGLAAGEHDTNLTPTEDERLVNIKNVNLRNISINVKSRYEANVGGLIAWAQNGFVIDNCSVEGSIHAGTKESFARVGGLVGSTLRGVITDSYTNVAINADTETATVYAGGLAGMTNRSAQVNCYTLGDVCVNAGNNNKATAGGLTGMSGGTNINCYTYGNVESLITTVDVGGINGRIAGIAVDYECCFNSSAAQMIAGKDVAEKVVSGTVVGEEIKSGSKTGAEMASDEFVNLLNTNKTNMTEILKDVSTYLEDMTENNKEGLSHFLFYTNDGSDLNTWKKGTISPVFGTEEIKPVDKTDHIASDEEFCSWAKHDYESKTGMTGTNASLCVNEDGTYEITMTDKDGKVLDTYTIAPKTGIGVNSKNQEVNLPQTGNNSAAGLLAAMGALAMIGFGFCLVKRSGISRRKGNAE